MPLEALRWLLGRHDGSAEPETGTDVDGAATVALPAEVADNIDRAFLSARIERIREELNAIEQVIRLREDYNARRSAHYDGG